MDNATSKKGYDSKAHVIAACILLGPIGYLYAICLPDLKLREEINIANLQLKHLGEQNEIMIKHYNNIT